MTIRAHRPRSAFAFSVLVFALCAAPALRAQEAEVVAAKETQKIEIAEALRLASVALDVPIVFQDRMLRSVPPITWRGAFAPEKAASLALWSRILGASGLTLSRVDEGDGHVLMLESATRAPLHLDAGYVKVSEVPAAAKQQGDAVITTVVHLTHTSPNDAMNALSAMFRSHQETIRPLPSSNAILMRGHAQNVATAVRALEAIERPTPAAATVRAFLRLRHSRANEIGGVLKDQLSVRRQRRANPQAQATTPPAEFRVTVHDRTNTLIVSGSAEQVREAELIVARLDVEVKREQAPRPENKVLIVRVENGRAKNIANTLSELFHGDGSFGRPGSSRSPRRTISFDDATNSILISADEKFLERAKRMIAVLDVATPEKR